MKRIIFLLVPVLIMGMSACQKTMDKPAGKGHLEIVMNMGNTGLKSALTDSLLSSSYQLLLSVADQNGVPVLEDKMISLFLFGGGFVSEKIEIASGNLQLTKFMVIDPSGNVIYAAPLEGSARAYLVSDPLPISFRVSPGELTTLSPEVLNINGASPTDFGYATFGMQIVNPLPVYALVMLNNPLIMAPTQITDAYVKVTSADGWQHRFYLERKVNKIEIKGGSEQYTFEVLKDGYSPVKFQFKEEELKMTTQENPLVLTIDEGPLSMISIQPGPDKGKDAMISDLDPDTNFGSWPYFEATYLSESTLAVMRTNRSLIWFDLNQVPKSAIIEKVTLTLAFETPLWDSLSNVETFAWYGAVFQKITRPWDENSVTWNNQPPTTESGQVFVSPQPQMSSNRRTYDVTSLYSAKG